MDIKYIYRNKLYPVYDGIYLNPKHTVSPPIVSYKNKKNDALYTLILFDPDALGGNKIHWLLINIPRNNIHNGECLLPYDGPHPPKGSGVHHYYFLLLEQMNNKKISNQRQFSTRFISMERLFKTLKTRFHLVAIRYFMSSYPRTV